MRYLRGIFIGLFQLSLASFFIIFLLLAFAPDLLEKHSPFLTAGPATLAASEKAPGSIKNLADEQRWAKLAVWPAWATDEDKDNVIRTHKALQNFEFSKFNTARNAIVEDMKERNVDPGDLYGVILTQLLGGKNAPSMVLYLLVMSLYGAVAIAVLGKAAHNVWFNPFYSGEGFSTFVQVVGMYFLGVLVVALFSFAGLAVVGLIVASHSPIFFLLAEFLVCMGALSIILWFLSLVTAPGLVADLLPKKKKTVVKGSEAGYRPRKAKQQERPSADDLYIEPMEMGAEDDDD